MAGGTSRIVRGYGLYEQLKEHKPAWLVAVDGDGDEVKINVPDVRQKHARVMVALREIAWVRCDLFDKKGGLLYRHQRNSDDRDAPAGELEDMPPTRAAAELSGLVNIMLRAQETVLIRHQQAMQQVLDAQMRLVDAAMKRLELQEVQYEHAMKLNHALSGDLVNAQLAQLQLGGGGGEDDGAPQSDRAIAAILPAMMRAAFAKDAPQQQQQQQPRKGPKHANGTRPKDAPQAHQEPAVNGG